MTLLRVLAPLPVWFLLVATSSSPTPIASPTPSPAPSPVPTPSPTPVPTNAFLTLDVTAGPPDTTITVTGGSFLSSEQMTLYWDPPSTKVAGSATTDISGNFTAHVKPFAGDAPGIHHLCASVPPNPCANFMLTAATPTPSPSASPDISPSPSASPSISPTPLESPTPVAALSGFDVISRPPFVFLPIVGVLAILVSLAYWVLSMVRKPRPVALPTAAVVHRATRPDYTAGFGAPPPAAPPAPPPPSAWADVLPPAAPPPARPAAGPEAAPPELPAAPDEPPDLPEPVED